METQRQWSAPAIACLPCLLGLFSVVVLLAHCLYPQTLPTRQAAWHLKAEPTFIDALAAVQRYLWTGRNAPALQRTPRLGHFPPHLVASLIEVACYAA